MLLPRKRRNNSTYHTEFLVPFMAGTTSFLYSADLHLLEVRRVPMQKSFNLSINPSNMHLLHGQARRTTCSLLDSAFVFVEEQGSTGVCGYGLSCWDTPGRGIPLEASNEGGGGTPASQASTAEPSPTAVRRIPTTLELKEHGRMVRLPDSAREFQRFCSSPKLLAVSDDEEGCPDEKVVPIFCTIASYETSFSTSRSGHMTLSSICNFPSQRFSVPVKAASLESLLNVHMKELRIYNIYVQHNSKLVLKTLPDRLSTFPEWKLW
jgi:hypothetical protein